MRFGLYLIGRVTGNAPAATIADPAFLAPFAQRAEALGFDSLFFADHIVYPAAKSEPYPYTESGAYPYDNPDMQLAEPMALCAYLAACTTTLHFGTAVLVLPQRHPMLLAKQTATIDRMSGGRLELGVGAGWLRDEFDALGYDFDGRGARTDEYIEVMRALWRQPVASFDGPTVRFRDVKLTTHPVQPGGVKIIVGGHSAPALGRAGRLGDAFLPAMHIEGSAAQWPGMIATVREHAEGAGRAGDAVELMGFGHSLDGARRLADLGATRTIIAMADADLGSALDHLARAADEIVHAFG